MTDLQRFELTGPLPAGGLAIEASAGTGKTFALAGLATRFVAEHDIRASELLIVTFTRAATTELRDRVRNRFADAARHLADPGTDACGDPLLDHLAGLPDRAVARERLERAVTEFDAATVSTIHGFATQVLGAIGSTSAIDPDVPLVDDTVELTAQICADVLASASVSGEDADHLPKYGELQTAVMTVLERPGLALLPEPGPGVTAEMEVLRNLVEQAVAAVRAHRRRIGTRSFTDILEILRDALGTAEGASAVIEALQSRYRVALIDEFQDTDPVQWDIFRSLFGSAVPGAVTQVSEAQASGTQVSGTQATRAPDVGTASALVLVGDPKQAIYAFRGADINTYLEAVGNHAEVRSLDTNWRSDGAALTAVATLLDGTSFGHDDIGFVPVGPAPKNADRRLCHRDGSPRPGLVVRLACDESIGRTTRKEPVAPEVRSVIWNDLAHQITDLLTDGLVPTVDPEGATATRPVVPSDVAVLVRSRKDGELIREVLTSRGIPAVVARGGSVLQSEAADHWRWLLEGLARPSDPVRARTFALSWFGGHDAAWVDAATDEDIAELQDDLHRWSEALTTRGIDELVRRVFRESAVIERVLAHPDGDRSVTDLDHLAELLRTQTGRSRPGVAALLAVLNVDPEADPNAEFEGDLASRRVASEADAVQIMTVWVAKGLEFPIACVPTMWTGPRSSPIVFHDPDVGRAYDLAGGKGWPDKAGAKQRLAQYERERAGEELRLLYVALTRARHQTLVWWSPVSGSNKSPLARVLFARDEDGNLDPELFEAATVKRCPDDDLLDRLAPLVERSGGTLEVSWVPPVDELSSEWTGAVSGTTDAPLVVAELTDVPPRVTRRWSFTGISAGAAEGPAAHGGGPAAAATAPELDERDEPFEIAGDPLHGDPAGPDPAAVVASIDDTGEESRGGPAGSFSLGYDHPTVSPLAPLPAGAAFGTLVHSVYEHIDFAAPDLAAVVRDQLGRELSWRSMSLAPSLPDATEDDGRSRLVDGVVASLLTPLGPLFDGRRLCDIAAPDRLPELGFELHLPRGGRLPTDRDIGALLLAHLPIDDPFRPWATEVAAGVFDVALAGHLNGEIDAVLRVTSPDRPDRYVVVDYKTNRLHQRDTPPLPGDYGPGPMVAQMAHHHYPLQALLYSVALHRYLRWRVPAYDPALHLGGAAYLFVRGMSGPGNDGLPDAPHGVCSWAIPPAAVVALSDLLAGVEPTDPTDGSTPSTPDPMPTASVTGGPAASGSAGAAAAAADDTGQGTLFGPEPGEEPS